MESQHIQFLLGSTLLDKQFLESTNQHKSFFFIYMRAPVNPIIYFFWSTSYEIWTCIFLHLSTERWGLSPKYYSVRPAVNEHKSYLRIWTCRATSNSLYQFNEKTQDMAPKYATNLGKNSRLSVEKLTGSTWVQFDLLVDSIEERKRAESTERNS